VRDVHELDVREHLVIRVTPRLDFGGGLGGYPPAVGDTTRSSDTVLEPLGARVIFDICNFEFRTRRLLVGSSAGVFCA